MADIRSVEIIIIMMKVITIDTIFCVMYKKKYNHNSFGLLALFFN